MAILNIGVTSFARKGPAMWHPNGTGLEHVVINMNGAASALDAYLATKTQWSVCPLDGNMWLESWPNDEDRQYPTVSLNYVGRINGQLPPDRISRGSGLGTASRSDLYYGVGITVSFGVTFSSATRTVTSLTNYEMVRPSAGLVLPGGSAGAYGVTIITRDNTFVPDSFIFANLSLQQAIVDFRSDEVVPGKYWQNSVTTMWTLI